MSIEFKLRRGTTAQHSAFIGAEGEVTVDTTKDTLVVHDSATPGGVPLAREDGSNATGDWPIDITGSAASAGQSTKIVGANWTIQEVGGVLFFQHGGNNKAKLDSSGNLTVVGDITAFGTV